MRFRELMEDDSTTERPELEISPEEVIETLKRDCAHFLSKAQGHWLYRGSRHYSEPFMQNVPFKPRVKTHADLVNNVLSEIMKADGFSATRKDCMFAAGDGMDVGGFGDGKVGVIFPVGPFSMTWFNKNELPEKFAEWVYGSYFDLGGGTIAMMSRRILMGEPEEDAWRELAPGCSEEQAFLAKFFWKHCKQAFHHGDDVKAAITSRSEIMLKCNSYHVVSYDYWRFGLTGEMKASLK